MPGCVWPLIQDGDTSIHKVSFKPGEQVPESGVYRVEHDAHRLMHEATLRHETVFPACKTCGSQVRFTLMRQVRDRSVLPLTSSAILQAQPRDSATDLPFRDRRKAS